MLDASVVDDGGCLHWRTDGVLAGLEVYADGLFLANLVDDPVLDDCSSMMRETEKISYQCICFLSVLFVWLHFVDLVAAFGLDYLFVAVAVDGSYFVARVVFAVGG